MQSKFEENEYVSFILYAGFSDFDNIVEPNKLLIGKIKSIITTDTFKVWVGSDQIVYAISLDRSEPHLQGLYYRTESQIKRPTPEEMLLYYLES